MRLNEIIFGIIVWGVVGVCCVFMGCLIGEARINMKLLQSTNLSYRMYQESVAFKERERQALYKNYKKSLREINSR